MSEYDYSFSEERNNEQNDPFLREEEKLLTDDIERRVGHCRLAAIIVGCFLSIPPLIAALVLFLFAPQMYSDFFGDIWGTTLYLLGVVCLAGSAFYAIVVTLIYKAFKKKIERGESVKNVVLAVVLIVAIPRALSVIASVASGIISSLSDIVSSL